MKPHYIALTLTVCLALTSNANAAPPNKLQTIPDFTKGDTIPENAKHDWNLGPTGLRGWMYCDKLVTKDARQIRVTSVAEGSPAAGTIVVGDVILGCSRASVLVTIHAPNWDVRLPQLKPKQVAVSFD